MRHVSQIFCLVTLCLTQAGCTRDTYPSGSFPWQRTAPLTTNPSPGGSPLFADLQRRAAEQQRLIEDQQRQLARLADLQRSNDQQALAARQRQQEAQWQQLQRNREVVTQQQQEVGNFDQLRQRATHLDSNNQDLHAQIARSQQQKQLMEDQVKLLQQQLAATAEQLAQTRRSQQATSQQMQTLQTSVRRRAGASISANNSLQRNLTAVKVPGMEVRQDGDLVRVGVPADRLFLEQTANLHQGAALYIDQFAEVVRKNYPQQIVGIEAYSDNAATTGTLWRSKHQLTSAQAMAVFEQLTQRHRMSAQQFFVLGHGENHPLEPNTTPAGRGRNRRIEMVIYPETFSGR